MHAMFELRRGLSEHQAIQVRDASEELVEFLALQQGFQVFEEEQEFEVLEELEKMTQQLTHADVDGMQ